MSAANSYLSDTDSDLPSRPEENLRDSSLPEEGAMCAVFTDEAFDDGKCDSSWSCSSSRQVDPKSFITDEMLEEEKRLHALGVEQEEKRTKSETELLNALPDQAREKQYERLKYLLNKSTMYTEYLVGRMNRQREEEEKRKERIQKRKIHLEQEEKRKLGQGGENLVGEVKETGSGQHEKQTQRKLGQGGENLAGEVKETGSGQHEKQTQNTDEEQNIGEKTETSAGEGKDKGDGQEFQRRSGRTRGSNKRKTDDMQKADVIQEPRTKRQKKKLCTSPESTSPAMKGIEDLKESVEDVKPGPSSEKQQDLGIVDDISPSSSKEAQKDQGVIGADDKVDEPELIEKAKIFGVVDEGDERCFINGEEVSFLQPKLMDGGVLRPYQLEGYSWLKVLYENAVNGILADEMGLGKTVQCVAILSHLVYMGIPGPFLICAPLSTIPNWFSEFQRFAPKVPTILYHGQKHNRVHLAKQIRRKHKIREGVFVQPVVITSYEVAMIDRKYLANHAWRYLIVDEGHRIKNTHCRLIRELRMYRSTHRLLLTGTPLQNSLAELWSLLNFLLPEIFDDLGSFEAWFDVSCINDVDSEERILQQERGKNILSMLHQILAPFMLRRLKSDVDLNIPPKKEILVFAPMTQQQMDFYSALVDRTIFSLIDQKNKVEDVVETTASGRLKRRSTANKVDYSLLMESEADKKFNKAQNNQPSRRQWKNVEQEEKELESWVQAISNISTQKVGQEKKQRTSQVTIKMRNVMMQLRKCCNHPYLLEHPLDPKTGDLALTEGVVTASGKMLVLDKMLAELKQRGHRVLIFSQMTRMLDLIEDFCQIRKYDFCRLDGSTHVDDRRDSMDVFNTQNSDKFLFLLSTRAGGLGINLTGADTVIIYDSDWNPQCDLQAQDRCHRIGQTKPVVVYRFVTANTIDQKIIERAAAKRKLEKMIIHKGKFKSGNFLTKSKPISSEELRDLLHSKDHESEVIGDTFAISKSEMSSLLDRSDLHEKWSKAKDPSHDQCKKEVEEGRVAPPKSKIATTKRELSKGKRKMAVASQFKLFKVMETEGDLDSSSITCKETDDSLRVTT